MLTEFHVQFYKAIFCYLFYLDHTVDITIEIKLPEVSSGIILITTKGTEVLPDHHHQEEVLEDRVVRDLELLHLQSFPIWYHRLLLLYRIEIESPGKGDRVLDVLVVQVTSRDLLA